jgi:uncharacterized protein GlcG (DUF336 family)
MSRRSIAAVAVAAAFAAPAAFAGCDDLPGYVVLQSDLQKAVNDERSMHPGQNGLGFNMWATIVDNSGIVCAVAYSGPKEGDQWRGSRVISAQKANTAQAFSLSNPLVGTNFPTGLALSTANLYSAVQPGGSLYGLQHSNPVDTRVAYSGEAEDFGTINDPMVGNRIGGVNVFGGGLGLYATGGKVVGGVGVSGDTSCEDHMVAWRLRNKLGLDHFGPKSAEVGGVSGDPQRPDNIIFLGSNEAPNGFKHPTCINKGDPNSLPAVQNP